MSNNFQFDKKHLGKYTKVFFLLGVFILGIAALNYIYANYLNYPVIRSDGEGYYAYLPAVVLYHDITLHSLIKKPLHDQVPQGVSHWNNTKSYLIKYPSGEAILMTPFFLIAYMIAYVSGKSLNGYSPPFQDMAAFSGLFYGVMGLLILWLVLQNYFKTRTILFVLIGLLFGTNLFHYATYDAIFSHIYSFFLFSAFLLIIERIHEKNSLPICITLGVVAGLIVITRPTNGLWLLFAVFFGIHSMQDMIERLKFWKIHWPKLFFAVVAFLCVVSIQLAYWKAITGSFLVYSYGDETFNFDKPEILNVLFSVKKGLFFWSPILLTFFPGVFFLARKARNYLVPILLFFPINVYVIASWYVWGYGGSFGQRPFVESMPMFAITLCALYEGIASAGWRRLIWVWVVVATAWSLWLMFKYWLGLIPYDGPTWDYFINTFFTMKIIQ